MITIRTTCAILLGLFALPQWAWSQQPAPFLGSGQSLEETIRRGEYLARAADCAACHTAPGGKPFAGGLSFKLPMIGTIYSTNR